MADRDDDIPDRKGLLHLQLDAEEEEMEHGPSEEIVLHKPENMDRPRDEGGKFKAKDEKEDEPELPLETEDKPEEPEEEPPVWARPPASWGKKFNEVWATADPKLQRRAYEREEQMRAGIEAAIPKAKFADEINQVIEPYRNTIRGLGIDEKTAINGLLKADHALRTLPMDQRRNYLLQLAGQYGIDLGQGGNIQQPQQGADPRYSALQNELINLKGTITNWEQRQEEAIQQTTLHEINNFAKGVEYFDVARPFMISALQDQGNEINTLNEAYEYVTGPDGPLYDLVKAAHQSRHSENQAAARDRAAKAARAAAVSPRSATPGSSTSTKAQDRRSMLRESLDGLSERL